MLVVADAPYGFNPSASRVLDRMLMEAGVPRSETTVITPVQWKAGMGAGCHCVVLAGEESARTVLGWNAPPDLWHGTILPESPQPPRDWNAYVSWCVNAPKYVVTYGLDKLHKMWDWHPLAMRDWQKAGMVERRQVPSHNPLSRQWVFDRPSELGYFGEQKQLAFDTELTPVWMFGAADAHQVHVMQWSGNARKVLLPVMQSPDVVKIAHNLQHDLAMCQLRFDMPVREPWFDTMGGAHLLNTALEKSLSPGISARFTYWPYHKWLANVDIMRYNGMDNVVCYDAAQEIQVQLLNRGLQATADHDHRLLRVLFDMQMRGFRVDGAARAAYEEEVQGDLIVLEEKLQELVKPVIRSKLARFQKPNLFTKTTKCKCCGGGNSQRLHCAKCGGLKAKPRVKGDYANAEVNGEPGYAVNPKLPHQGFKPLKGATTKDLQAWLPTCRECAGAGKTEEWLEFNPGSNDQVADVIYRGLGIAPRRYKGKETVKAEQLAKIQDKHPIIREVVAASKLRADLATVERMAPGPDGKLHCVFDPWGTESGRVAGKEGLLAPGTNPMNIPKKARRFVVPDPGYTLMYPDMAQIEARVVAKLSEKWDKNLMQAFTVPIDWPESPKHGKVDSHTFVQQMVSRWVKISRDQAKRLTYAVMYGVSPKQLAVELSAEAHRKGEGGQVTEVEALAMIQAFFLAFPGVLEWHKDVERQLIQNRTIVSLSGRERHWPGRIMDRTGTAVMREVLKEAYSFGPQEVGARVLAEGMIHLAETCPSSIHLMVHVHDACLMQTPTALLESAKEIATKALSREMYGMWFPCDMKVGMNWYEAS